MITLIATHVGSKDFDADDLEGRARSHTNMLKFEQRLYELMMRLKPEDDSAAASSPTHETSAECAHRIAKILFAFILISLGLDDV